MAIDSLGLPDIDKMDRLNNRLLAAMPRSATTLLKPFIRQLMLPPGFVCLDAGEPIEQIYFPVSGLISQVVSTSEGEVVETAMVGREGAVGLQSAFGQRLSFTRAMVLVGGTFYAIPAEQLRLALSEEAKALVYRYVETELAEALQLAVCNAVHAGPARLARWLLQSAHRTGSELLLLTQEQISEMLGVRRTTITLLSQELQKRGAIKYSRGKITITDRQALQAAACECYGVIAGLYRLPIIGAETDSSAAAAS